MFVALWFISTLALPTPGFAEAQLPPPFICFWSPQGPACVERENLSAQPVTPEGTLLALLQGPTPSEQDHGLWSAIPVETSLDEVITRPDGTFIVRLNVPPSALAHLDPETFEIITQQIGASLAPWQWRDLRIQTWDPLADDYVPLAEFLPHIPVPHKETAVGEPPSPTATTAGQPPAAGQGQPAGALSGKTIYVSAGHGWLWNDTLGDWRTQRPPYPSSPYEGPIIEDHNNAEAVNQYLLPYLWNAGAMVWPVRERDMSSVAVVVDNDALIPGNGYAETGLWMTSTITGTGYAGGDYRWTWTTPATDTVASMAIWTATLPADGHYAVYAWYRSGSGRAPDAQYTIYHAGGQTTVTVDQRYHGLTWHYLGSYGFRADQPARVALSSRSTASDTIVVADAVRFGSGVCDDLTGIETTATHAPDRPWWEMAAYYYTQRMGMSPPYGDVTARPIYARWEHANTGDDAVYVSWHSNGISGYQTNSRGTISIIHNGEGYPITPGSEALRDAIHAEILNDLRAGWDPTWPGFTRSMNLGELRELWDEDPANALPGTLIEVAYHDHPTDTDALKEPTFNALVARAIYQGIVHYFEQRDGLELTLLPEPPTHLAVQNVGPGQVRLSWRPPQTDTMGLVGDAATGYRVYTSTDGVGWSNGLPVDANTTAITLTNLAEGQLLLVRVTATNAGGESFPTETLAVRTSDGNSDSPAEILLVNGFDRLNRTMTIPDDDPVEGLNMRLWLNQMNRYDYTLQHGLAISLPFDSASNEAVSQGSVSLNDYKVVDWLLGEESTADETLDPTERAQVTDFLTNGGALFLSGTEVGWHLDALGAAPDFYNTVLRASYAGDDAETYTVTPHTGSIFDGLPTFRFDAPDMYDPDFPDQLLPMNGATTALDYVGGLSGTAAVTYADPAGGCQRLVYFGFPFETIWPDWRADVMARIISFLGVCLAPTVDTHIASPTDGSAHRIPPVFTGTVKSSQPAALRPVEVQIEHLGGSGESTFWTGSDWSTATTWLTATGVPMWTYPLPSLSSDGDYRLRARGWITTDGRILSDTTPAEATFTYDTISPTAATLITPTGGTWLRSPVSVTLMWATQPPDGGSPLAYRLMVDGQHDTILTPTTAYTLSHPSAGWHTWGVQVFDAAGNHAPWVTDTFHYPGVETWITTPSDGSFLNTVPLLAGRAESEGAAALRRVELQLQRDSDGRYWLTSTTALTGSVWISASTWVTAATWLTATGTAQWAYPLPALLATLDDGGYHVRARARTTNEVDISPAVVAYTFDATAPPATTLLTPTHGVSLSARPILTLTWQAVPPDGGAPLGYRVELEHHVKIGARPITYVITTTESTHLLPNPAGGVYTWGVQVFDAAGNCSPWVNDTFTILQHNAWLPVVWRDFSANCMEYNSIVNGGFEADAGWTFNGGATYATSPAPVHSGIRSAQTGIPPGHPGEYNYSSVSQAIELPAVGAVTLHLWLYPIGEGDDSNDKYYIGLSDETGNYHSLDYWQADTRAWERREYDLSAYRGQVVTLYVGTWNDGDDDTAALYVDDVGLIVCLE